MTYRINGIGTTISPMPDEGCYSIAMKWATFVFVPIFPVGFRAVKGGPGNTYYELGDVSFKGAMEKLGAKGVFLTLAYGVVQGVSMAGLFVGILSLAGYLKSGLH